MRSESSVEAVLQVKAMIKPRSSKKSITHVCVIGKRMLGEGYKNYKKKERFQPRNHCKRINTPKLNASTRRRLYHP